MAATRDVLLAADLEAFIAWCRERRFQIVLGTGDWELYRIRVNEVARFTGIYRRQHKTEYLTISEEIAKFVHVFYHQRASEARQLDIEAQRLKMLGLS